MKKLPIVFTLSIILFFGTFSSATASVNSQANFHSNNASEKIPDRYIVVLEEGFTPQEVAKAHGLAPQFIFKKALNGFAGAISSVAAEKLQEDPRVKYVEQDQIYHITSQQLPTGMDRINLENNALAKVDGIDGPGERNGAVIAIIDTGVDLDHPDLNVNTSYGYECVTLLILVQCYQGQGYGDDDHNHGTHVAGIAAALDNGIGVVGAAPGAIIVPVKVLDATGSGSVMGIVAGIEYVTLKAGYIDVANMSLGGAYSQAINDAVQNSINAGVVYVVAAGNEMVDASTRSPASVADAITVSAIADFDGSSGGFDDQTKVFYKNAEHTEILCTENKDDSVACFSNNGRLIDIAAPGVNILSTTKDNTYSVYSGTSMASPHVAGAAALIRAQDFGMSPAQVWSELQGMTTPQDFPDGFTEDFDGYPEPLLMLADNPASNPIPVANAGADQNAKEKDIVTLDGTLSEDPDFEPISYLWSQTSGPVVTLDNQTSPSPSFTTPTVFVNTELVFSLVVNDGVSNSVADFVSVIVENSINEEPTADAGSDQTVNEEELVILDGNGSSDPNNDSLTYLWSQTAGTAVSLTGYNTTTPSFTGPSVEAGGEILTFSLVVSDGKVLSLEDTVDITISDVPPTPTVHVANLEYDTSGKNNWNGKVWITVEYEGNSGLVDGANVYGNWYDDNKTIGSSSCTTDSTGVCQVTQSTRATAITFQLTGIIKDGSNYSQLDNYDIDGDSDGSEITLVKGGNSGDNGGDTGGGSISEADCQSIVNQYEQKVADGKKISTKLQSDYDQCIALYPALVQ